ncbi:hypothetical protein PG997_002824 [Apiospora hydei]|uniref:Ankyrin repeat protein n=1 Tax=Apiospora hydei TaxID=1337664 RepID=A0ABR1WXH3_9PEZI
MAHPEVEREVSKAINYAAYANQPQTLRTLLGHYKQTHTKQEFLEQLDFTLVLYSCKRGAPDTTHVLLEYGAHPNETDNKPRSCLQLAARSGDAATVKALLDAGAHLGAPQYKQHRTRPEHDGYRRGLWRRGIGELMPWRRLGGGTIRTLFGF